MEERETVKLDVKPPRKYIRWYGIFYRNEAGNTWMNYGPYRTKHELDDAWLMLVQNSTYSVVADHKFYEVMLQNLSPTEIEEEFVKKKERA